MGNEISFYSLDLPRPRRTYQNPEFKLLTIAMEKSRASLRSDNEYGKDDPCLKPATFTCCITELYKRVTLAEKLS